jgi:ubiquitin-protein ligase
LKEIDNERLPTVGVSARPLSSNLFEWHANIKGPAGTLYEGGVFHFALQIPESYPHQPPTVTVFNELPHPNVFGQNICLDILNAQKVAPSSASKELGSFTNGWSSGYTI